LVIVLCHRNQLNFGYTKIKYVLTIIFPEIAYRKVAPKWMDQIRVSCDSSLEGPNEDGYNWRKYGQKDILGTKHPR